MIRKIKWENVILTIPTALANELEQMAINQRTISMIQWAPQQIQKRV
jgi:hypothetical protein